MEKREILLSCREHQYVRKLGNGPHSITIHWFVWSIVELLPIGMTMAGINKS